ncbi:Lethal(2) giant larvae protein SRO7 [Podospora australis]|uniref:Lethal(2) giant larvae protein SRO7 n=1 Tax=Podospora australis TaxID=1536484 RepID=A0AAN6X2U6_9PEZI|nr:Lethal(2) giant larvae protein SRO7 [Podospora australis]
MAGFLRSKQVGIQNDLSAGIVPGSFDPDEQARYGINSQVSCIAYDPTQSIVAVGTTVSQFSPTGKIYVFGSGRTQKVLTHPKQAAVSFQSLAFVANRIVSVDNHGELGVWDLMTGQLVGSYKYPRIVSVVTDPGIDWAFIGTQHGDVSVYDLDRERPGNFRLPNFWREKDPRALQVGLVGMQLHPRDIGKLLIGYTHGCCVYSFKQGQVQKFFEWEGLPGGMGTGPGGRVKKSRLTNVVWHPTGTFILAAYECGSLVFWDAKEGRVVAVRNLYETRINEPGKRATQRDLVPFGRIKWCCKGQNPDDTALLIAGGFDRQEQEKGITFLDLGPTPVYATSSWDVLRDHFEGRRRVTLQTPPGAEVVDYCLIPRASPYFDGAQDPIAIMAMLSSGEIITMSFPSGYPISPTNMLHPSLSFIHPFVQKINVAMVPRERWLGLVERRSQGEPILKGGLHGATRRRPIDFRNIIQVAHADSTIRIWDAGYGDEIENPGQIQVDVARALDRFDDVTVTALHMADSTGEFAAGTRTGEVVIYKWGANKYHGKDATQPLNPNPGGLTDISTRAEPSLKEGLQPFVLYEMMQGPISVISVSDVGFIGVGSEGGFFSIIDMRGPSVIFSAPTTEFIKEEKRGFLKHKSSSAKEYPTAISFGVLTLEGDSFSSIACFVGTNLGHIATFKLLPAGQGYTAKLAGVAKSSDKVIAICPVNSETGHEASATGHAVAGLREGRQVHGILVAITQTEIRAFKPATAKGASKSFDDQLCDAARVVDVPRVGVAVVAVFGDRTTRAYSIPALKELGRSSLALIDPSRTMSAVVSKTGEIFAWNGPSEISVMPVFGTGSGLPPSTDTLVNPQLPIPPRPTISNMQWLSGTQYVSPTDLDLLIGGDGRPPSKRMMEAAAAEQRGGTSGATSRGTNARAQEGWGDYLTRQLNERTEKLSFVDDAMNRLQEASQGWADDVNKQVKDQKRSMLLGGLKKSFF